ncbi:tRNA (guanosine(37)-N1)-methyltransferase TrmD [Candidatus Symbiobacter mobilis]|uniref:tRNA (guanine-N(1)-)-methyltransferase n=1 Tax=Candidatus Symbiobacter mobilis CR TaxID=946483 RepID=U5NCG7_9BURK|nr:tRNA (guanosine(37)-N1)-methyltransferase TrmD [Candidatus Symbiobacter mobilis]AGX87913.1 tRNA (guanine-N1-)-methyltransferase [Candidatus Symbiobacter mobilis CR]
MLFDVITLFPQWFSLLPTTGVTRRAFEREQMVLRCCNPREFSDDPHGRVDDRPFGGGPGMVMQADPLARAVDDVRSRRSDAADVLLFSPSGRRLTHDSVQRWASGTGAILVCGRYEGIDQRFIDRYVTEEISLGDFVLSGGEIAALALLDAVARLLPGVLHDAQSAREESFHPDVDGLLDCPQYTRPREWSGVEVPPVLLSGDHRQIEHWRREQRLLATGRLRPDVVAQGRQQGRFGAEDEQILATIESAPL